MALQSSLLNSLCSLLLLVGVVNALKFDLAAHSGGESAKKERCIRNFVGDDTLVVVTATVDGYKGDGMVVNMHVRYKHKKRALLSQTVGLICECAN